MTCRPLRLWASRWASARSARLRWSRASSRAWASSSRSWLICCSWVARRSVTRWSPWALLAVDVALRGVAFGGQCRELGRAGRRPRRGTGPAPRGRPRAGPGRWPFRSRRARLARSPRPRGRARRGPARRPRRGPRWPSSACGGGLVAVPFGGLGSGQGGRRARLQPSLRRPAPARCACSASARACASSAVTCSRACAARPSAARAASRSACRSSASSVASTAAASASARSASARRVACSARLARAAAAATCSCGFAGHRLDLGLGRVRVADRAQLLHQGRQLLTELLDHPRHLPADLAGPLPRGVDRPCVVLRRAAPPARRLSRCRARHAAARLCPGSPQYSGGRPAPGSEARAGRSHPGKRQVRCSV